MTLFRCMCFLKIFFFLNVPLAIVFRGVTVYSIIKKVCHTVKNTFFFWTIFCYFGYFSASVLMGSDIKLQGRRLKKKKPTTSGIIFLDLQQGVQR